MKQRSYTEKGQAVLLIVLVSVVIFTIGIAAVAQTAADVKLSGLAEESALAFAGAEAGMELALNSEENGTWTDPNGLVSTVYTVRSIPDSASSSYNSGALQPGDVYTIWLVSDPSNPLAGPRYAGDITISWEPNTAEVEFILYYLKGSDLLVNREYVTSGNSFTVRTNDPPLSGNAIVLRVKSVTETLASITVSGYDINTFPRQGIRIESFSQTPSGITRRVQGMRLYDQVPSLFEYVLYSQSAIRK